MRAIYCAGDQGRVVLDVLRAGDSSENVVFVDDDPDRHGRHVAGVEVIGPLENLFDIEEPISCNIAYGAGQGHRLALASDVREAGYRFFNAVHPDASVSPTADLGNGLTINAQSYIGPDATIGDHVLVDSVVNLSHDVDIGPGAIITPNATVAGGVDIGVDAYLGPGATILRGLSIGDHAVVGAGAVVTEDVPAGDTVVGVPAESI